MLFLQFISCNVHDKNDHPIVEPSITDATYYVKENIPLDKEFYSNGMLCESDNYIYLNGSISGEGIMLIYNLTDDSVEFESLPAVYSNTVALAINENGYYIFHQTFNNAEDNYQHSISHIQKGALVSETSLNNYLSIPESFFGNICAVGSGNELYLAAATQFVVISEDEVERFDLPRQVVSLCKTSFGSIYVIGNDYIYVYDIETGSFTEDIEKSEEISKLSADDYYLKDGYDICYTNSNGLYGYNFGTNVSETILSWIGSGLYYPKIDNLVCVNNERIILYGATEQYGENKLMSLLPYEGDLPERKVITVSYLEDGRGIIPDAAIQFNNSQIEYEIICEEYVSKTGNDYQIAMNQLDGDILSGELADVLVLETKEDVDKYGEYGLLLDLYTVMDNKNDLFQCIREYCETNGALFGITPEFSVSTLISKTDNLPEYDVWNSTAFLDTVDALEDGKHLFAYSSQHIIQEWVLSSVIWEFLDLENATCSFENDKFIRVLEYLASLPEDYTTAYEDNTNHYRNDDVIFLSDSPSNFSTYLKVKAILGPENEICYVGYPSKEGGVTTIDPMAFYAINANCQNIDGAYAFLNYLLSGDSVINENKGMQRIPSSKKTLFDWLESEGQFYYYYPYDDMNNFDVSFEPFGNGENGYEAKVDEALVYEYMNWIDSLHPAKQIPDDIRNIITEELSIFYGTDKEASDTAHVIQSRVSIWLAEHN